jgi:RHS repeat-associated protein
VKQTLFAVRSLAVATTLSLLLIAQKVSAQEPWDYLQADGTPNFTVTVPVELGFVNLANGNLHLEIPLGDPPQRGQLHFNPKFVYDSRNWIPVNANGQWVWNPIEGLEDPTWSDPSAHGAWAVMTDYDDITGQLRPNPAVNSNGRPTTWATYTTHSCGGSSYRVFNDFELTLGESTLYFDVSISQNSCTGIPVSANGYSTDGSGYHLYVTADSSTGLWDTKVIAPDGTDVWTVRDANGNFFSSSPSSQFPLEDTLQRKVVTVSGTPQGSSFSLYYDILNSQGSTSRYTANYSTINISTSFHQAGVQDGSGTNVVVTSLNLPDGTSYQFQYDSYGELSSVTLPTGGTITYGYTNFTDAFGNVNRWLTSKTSAGSIWRYAPTVITSCPSGASSGCGQNVVVQKPSGDSATYIFTINGAPWLTQVNYVSATGSTQYTTKEAYDFSQYCSTCFGHIGYVHPTTHTEYVPNSPTSLLTKQTTFTYDSPQRGNITTLKEWNFYTGSPSTTPDRETDMGYQAISIPVFAANGGPSFVSNSTIYKPSSVIAYSSGTQVAKTLYTYDSTTPASFTGASNHDDSDYGTGDTQRGNLSKVSRWISGNLYLNNFYTYDTTGQIFQASDALLYPTTYSYTDEFVNGSSLCGTQTHAYPTLITYPISTIFEEIRYDCGTGKVMFKGDQNHAYSYFYYNDVLSRPTLAVDPLSGWSLNVYGSSTQTDIYRGITDTSQSSSCTGCRHDQRLLDSLGRASSTVVANDPDGSIHTIFGYDSNGRLASATNPYRSTTESTYGTATATFDVLDRLTGITQADGNTISIAIGPNASNVAQACSTGLGYPKLVTDETGRQKVSWIDGFGRIVEVDEPTSSGTLSVATCYQYDVLNNLLSVTQKGGTSDSSQWRTRSFIYDGLSRVVSATTPEGGTTQYSYGNGNGGFCAGDPHAVCSVTDARGITTSFSYDALSRLTGKSYSDSTPPVIYYYDQTSYDGLTIMNGIDRRTGMSDGSGQTAWSYDLNGRVIAKQQTIAGVTKSISYSYNLDGSIASITYPSGRVISYQYNNSQRPVSAVDTQHNINYLTSAHYAAAGLLTAASQGASCCWSGISETNTFNNRLQITRIQATSPVPLTLLDLGFVYDQGGGKNNGDIVQVNNNKDGTRSVSYTYDQLRRLLTAKTSNSTTWGDSYVYDPWGNLLQKIVTQGTAENLTVAVNNKNQISGYTYDAAGNLKWDTLNALNFDAENRMTPVAGLSYTYDGSDTRVGKSDGSVYWNDDYGQPLAQGDTSGNIKNEFVYFNSQRIGYLDLGAGNPYMYLSDQLGSTSVIASGDGKAIMWEADYYPFGTKRVITNNFNNHYLFTGYEFDYETGYHYAVSRYQSPNIGRFYSVDPQGSADLANPQTWNRYSYVMNRPTVMTDTVGLDATACAWCGYVPVIGIIGDLLGIFGGGGPSFHPNGPRAGQSGAGQDTGPLQGETLGLPNRIKLPQPSLSGVLLPAGTSCEFGVCVPVGTNFGPGLVLAGAAGETVCVIAEPCGAGELVLGGIFIGTVALIDAVRTHFSNVDENRQFRQYIVPKIEKRCGRSLSEDEKQRLHQEITKQGYSPEDIIEIGVGMFCPGN